MLAVLKKFLAKYFLEVLPSVVATVLGAYIVTHYVNTRPPATPAATLSNSAATTGMTPAVGAKVAVPRKTASPEEHAETTEPEADRVSSNRTKSGEGVRSGAGLSVADKKAKRRADSKTPSKAQPAVSQKSARRYSSDVNELAEAALDRVRARSRTVQMLEPPTAAATTPRISAVEQRQTVVPAEPVRTGLEPLPAPIPITEPVVSPKGISGTSLAQSEMVWSETSSRPTPPADIPSGSQRESASPVETMFAAARSVFQSVVPR